MDPLPFLYGLERLGMKFGLANMTTLCAGLGNPERAFRSVIVAGTNGKGSVTAMAATALRAAGYRSARYTSPHLERLEERFVIDDREVDTPTLIEVAGAVQVTVESLVRDGRLPALPTFFECATAIAFELFRRAGVTIAVLEVGLGGRLDATNVVTPIAAAITSIDFDHESLLGTTIESIAREKAGIIKDGIPVVCGPVPAEAERVIAAACAEHDARFIRALDRVHMHARMADGDTIITLRSHTHRLPATRLALRGRHQAQNAAVAVCLLEELIALGFEIGDAAIQEGLAATRWPARLERLRFGGTDVLLDAAHNAGGARALADYLIEIGWRGHTLVFGVMRDKNASTMLSVLAPLCARVICTTAVNPRALRAAELADLVRTVPGAPNEIHVADTPEAAVRLACRLDEKVIVAGSIFLVGPLHGILR